MAAFSSFVTLVFWILGAHASWPAEPIVKLVHRLHIEKNGFGKLYLNCSYSFSPHNVSQVDSILFQFEGIVILSCSTQSQTCDNKDEICRYGLNCEGKGPSGNRKMQNWRSAVVNTVEQAYLGQYGCLVLGDEGKFKQGAYLVIKNDTIVTSFPNNTLSYLSGSGSTSHHLDRRKCTEMLSILLCYFLSLTFVQAL